MRETPDDLVQLQSLLDRSIASAGPFLRRSLQMPEHSMSAAQVVACLDQVVFAALATTTARGEPRVAPIAALFWRGQFHIPTVMEAARTRHIVRRPAVSLTWYDVGDRAMIVHGRANVLDASHPDFATLDGLHLELSGSSVTSWGTGAYLRVEAESFFTFLRG